MQDRKQLRASGVVFRVVVERIDERHHKPAHAARPELLRIPGLLVGPALLPGLVPTMKEQAGLRIARVPLHQHELFCDVGKCLRMMRDGGVLGAEGLGHVEAIEPHLIRVALLMPVAAFGVARLPGELAHKECRGGKVAPVEGDAIEQQQLAAKEDVVELLLGGLEGGNRSIRSDELIDCGLDVVEVAGVDGLQPHRVHAIEERA